jgi:hypothetical protein
MRFTRGLGMGTLAIHAKLLKVELASRCTADTVTLTCWPACVPELHLDCRHQIKCQCPKLVI